MAFKETWKIPEIKINICFQFNLNDKQKFLLIIDKILYNIEDENYYIWENKVEFEIYASKT